MFNQSYSGGITTTKKAYRILAVLRTIQDVGSL